MPRVLVVEDDMQLLDRLSKWLTADDYLVEATSDGGQALILLQDYTFDVIVLDWQLPGLSGIEICRHYRKSGGTAPILLLTGKDSIEDKDVGFTSGVDDYLTKPFNPRELSLRLAALLKRPRALAFQILSCPEQGWYFDTWNKCIVKDGGDSISLMPKEAEILELLMRNPNRLFAANAIIERLWPTETGSADEVVKSWMYRLRQKLDIPGLPCPINTKRKLGYVFELQVKSQISS